jgi:hypothetical protein
VATSICLLNDKRTLFETVQNIAKLKLELGIMTATNIKDNVKQFESSIKFELEKSKLDKM